MFSCVVLMPSVRICGVNSDDTERLSSSETKLLTGSVKSIIQYCTTHHLLSVEVVLFSFSLHFSITSLLLLLKSQPTVLLTLFSGFSSAWEVWTYARAFSWSDGRRGWRARWRSTRWWCQTGPSGFQRRASPSTWETFTSGESSIRKNSPKTRRPVLW